MGLDLKNAKWIDFDLRYEIRKREPEREI